MRVSESGLAFVCSNEGFSAVVYNDNGHSAIGFGHDIQPGEEFTPPITRLQAQQLLMLDMANRYEPTLNSLVPPTCTQNQFDALADFAYNEGDGALAILLSHGWDQVTIQLPRWVYEHVNGVPARSATLEARREKEIELFST